MDTTAWHTKAGGRKFLVTGFGMVLCALGAAMHADGNYYLALGGMTGAFVAGNYGVEKVHANKPTTRRDSSGLPLPEGH